MKAHKIVRDKYSYRLLFDVMQALIHTSPYY
jgi:hypothetical protein